MAASARRLRELPVSLLALTMLADPIAAQLPYNPTRIYTASTNDRLAYVLRPTSQSQYRLSTLDLTRTIGLTNLRYDTIYDSLPFLNDETVSVISVPETDGNLTVYTGNCTLGSGSAQIWRFTPESDGIGNGTWTQQSIGKDNAEKKLDGPNYLATGVSFSSNPNATSDAENLYVFGGMCPDANATQDTWMTAADYSNLMLILDPMSSDKYDLGVTSSRGPPIAEAGSSLTPLAPSYSKSGDGTQSQTQNFVLLGGHTQGAFINMSQVAVFSLPQETWTFLPVEQPSNTPAKLTTRNVVNGNVIMNVDPRSGHSAVLSSDGQSIIMFGGWIGDVNTPADPQLAILHLGDGYGGDGSWRWTVPSAGGAGAPRSGTGVYGHGATMLPGDVMMVVGGYTMNSASDKRRATQNVNEQAFFFNVSSNTWLTEYTAPPLPAEPSKGPLSTTGRQAGLGVGIAIAVAVIIALAIFYCWYTRRLEKKREQRELELRNPAMTGSPFGDEYASGGIDGSSGMTAYNSQYGANSSQGQGWRSASGHEAERTGLLVEIPSPTRGLRRGGWARGGPHNAPRYDNGRMSRGSGNIHVIAEDEEEQSSGEDFSEKVPNRHSDPFTDPAPLRSHPADGTTGRPPSWQQPQHHRSPEDEAWLREWEKTADEMIYSGSSGHNQSSNSSGGGRKSPTKSDRTASTLSDASHYSHLSNTETAVGSLTRALSVRSGQLLNAVGIPNLFAPAPSQSPTRDKRYNPHFGSSAVPAHEMADARRSRSLTNSIHRPDTGSTTEKADDASFHSAQTSFSRLQAEGEALLGGPPGGRQEAPRQAFYTPTSGPSSPVESRHKPPFSSRQRSRSGTTSRPDPIFTGTNNDGPYPYFATRPSPTGAGPAAGGGGGIGWLGSVRRALNRSNTGNTARSAVSQILTGTRSTSLTASSQRYAGTGGNSTADHTAANSSSSHSQHTASGRGSPDKRKSGPPRRAASDAGLWKARRGARDWLSDTHDDHGDALRDRRRRSGDDWGAPEDMEPYRDDPQQDGRGRNNGEGGGEGDEDAESDWDVEAAAERRVVQVTFTVPRSRLRVVNADADVRSLVSSVGETAEIVGVREGEVGGQRGRVGSGESRVSQGSLGSRESGGESRRQRARSLEGLGKGRELLD
ncbi:hypothetical protein LTS18_004245 [Coniosporium uncinatum]|uniref:Uncharacterized protein n=1 Tax=Coniosporium uncinatum TaxID=93489 RepID=A0ACC3E0B9_9PEZI|nr:hypothetical protein LTS18_004245 [Coniosporium uncinatum]